MNEPEEPGPVERSRTARDPEPVDAEPAPHEPRRLDPRVVRVWRLTSAGATLAAAVGAAVLAGYVPPAPSPVVVAAAVLLAGAVAVVFWPPARYRAWSFRLRDADVRLRRGVLWRTVSVVPYARIQHVDTRRGPLDRWAGLAQLVIYTAGTRGASIPVPGLDAAEAERLRETLARSSGLEDAV